MTIATYSQEEKTDWIDVYESERETMKYQMYTKNTAWFETVYKNNDEKHEGEIVRRELHLYKFDCDKKLWGVLSWIRYNDDSEIIVESQVKEFQVDMDYLVPNSNASQFYKCICNRVKKD
jgi:hypothetical protein